MTTAAQFQTLVTKAAVNMDRLDGFLNGDETTVVETDSGLVPSIQKLIADGLVDVDVTQASIEAAITNDAAFRTAIGAGVPVTQSLIEGAITDDATFRTAIGVSALTQASIEAAITDDAAFRTAIGAGTGGSGLPIDGSVDMTGTLKLPSVFTVQAPTYAVSGDYGLIDRTGTVMALVQGTASSPISSETFNKPAVYIERHTSGRLSEPPSGLTDPFLDSNWLLTPTLFVQTVMQAGASNAATGIHSRVMSLTAAGSIPTATNTGALSQAGVNGSVNCLCAITGIVHAGAPSGQENRSIWAANLEVEWSSGNAPANMIGIEVDIRNTGGGAYNWLPYAGPNNNFVAYWAQSAARGGSFGDERACTTAFYVTSNVAYTGWRAAMVVVADIFDYGVILQNTRAASSATGVSVQGVGWSKAFHAVGDYAGGAVDVINTRNVAGTVGLSVGIGRANDDGVILAAGAAGNNQLTVTGDANNPVLMRLGGVLERLTKTATITAGGVTAEFVICA